MFPLPAPATLALLHNAPVVGVGGKRETVTPTAAAILTTLAREYGALPPMTLRSVGYGAGSRDDASPNVLRVLIGEEASTLGVAVESIVELETNIDDMNPQAYDYIMERLFAAGALDVTLTPMQMKKNRPGTRLQVLAPIALADELGAIILNESTMLGVREQILRRHTLARESIAVETPFGTLRAKVAQRPDGRRTVIPEYDDCARAAREYKVPLSRVMDAVKAQAERDKGLV